MTDFSELDLKWEWLPGDGVQAPELRATWARLKIYVDGRCLTLVEDIDSGSSRRSLYVPLYPLAEWVAYNWWHLVADYRAATLLSQFPSYHSLFATQSKPHRQRHSIRAAGDGFSWPNLFIIPQGETTRLFWRADEFLAGASPIRFLTSGEANVDSNAVRGALTHLVESVLTRLDELGIEDSALEREWNTIRGAEPDEEAFCVAAARLGLDPYSEAHNYEEQITAAASTLDDEELLGDFLDAVDPEKIQPTLQWILDAKQEIDSLTNGAASPRLPTMLDEKWTIAAPRPWETGWSQARTLRDELGVELQDKFPVDDLVRAEFRGAPARSFHAIGGKPAQSTQHVVLLGRRQRPQAQRFTLARALWHVVLHDSPLYLITSSYTDRQKVERAFAAEILAPASGIEAMLDADPHVGIDDDVVDDISAAYEVSPTLVRHQIENQLLESLTP